MYVYIYIYIYIYMFIYRGCTRCLGCRGRSRGDPGANSSFGYIHILTKAEQDSDAVS